MSSGQLAQQTAEHLLRQWGKNELPIGPEEIAAHQDILVAPMPACLHGGVSGMLVRIGNNFGILYATHIDNEGFHRFSIAHELGHYFLPGHPQGVFEIGSHASSAGFVSSDRYEQEADHFASGLLMPAYLFDPAMRGAGEGLNAVKYLAALCRTSLTSTAIRFVQRTSDAAAIIVSRNERIEYCFMSEALKEYPGLRWPSKGAPLPTPSATFHFNQDSENVQHARQDDGVSEVHWWFSAGFVGRMHEEVIGLGSYGRTLTVLTDIDLPDPEEIEEEADLLESLTPRFRKR